MVNSSLAVSDVSNVVERWGGHDCIVVVPSLIPVKTGVCVNTDLRDAVVLLLKKQ